jgi:hypothetical protein
MGCEGHTRALGASYGCGRAEGAPAAVATPNIEYSLTI